MSRWLRDQPMSGAWFRGHLGCVPAFSSLPSVSGRRRRLSH